MKTNKKFIFTDIDGVLNPHWAKRWNEKSVNIYNKVCKEFDLLPVITSTWRLNHSKEKLQEIFEINGIDVKIYDILKMQDVDKFGFRPSKERGAEIKEYLNDNICDNFVVIDDKIDDIVKHINSSKIVKCRSWIGLDDESYDEIKKIFN